jgi:Bacterial capsule synthesis protein PGA_cap/Carboxypeptidase regulatory-like domain
VASSLRIQRLSLASGLSLGALLCASPALAQPYAFDGTEATYQANYLATPIDLTGVIVDEDGAPVDGAVVTMIGWGSGAVNAGQTATTDGSGGFTLPVLARRSGVLRVEHPGHYTEIIPVDLQRPLAELSTDVGAIVLVEQTPGRARLVFGGDTMFGRRFVDADEDGIEGEPGDLIQPATRAADAEALLGFVRDVLEASDHTQVNLECPITDDPATPHPTKTYTFFSYPETLTGLRNAGVRTVNLANNHVYDFLEGGFVDTLANVTAADLEWFGAGTSETAAKNSVLRPTLAGVDLSFQGFSQQSSDGSTQHEYLLVAKNSPPKGGALWLTSSNLSQFVAAESPARFTIPVMHGGTEYSEYPTSTMRAHFINAVTGGAGLVVAHHTHTAHGIGVYNAGAGPRFVIMSLGNLLFDQDRFETFQSFLAVADVDLTALGGQTLHRLRLIPYHMNGYTPRLLTGDSIERFGREIGHLSTNLPSAPADGLGGATVFAEDSRLAVLASPADAVSTDAIEAITLPISGLTTGAVAVNPTLDGGTLARVQTAAAVQCEYGREILRYGDFEDHDADDEDHEGDVWSQSTSRYIESSVVRSGTGAGVILRKSSNTSTAALTLTHRIAVTPGTKLTLTGYYKGSNAGELRVQVRWYSSAGATLSTVTGNTRAPGTYDWTLFSSNYTAPASTATMNVLFTGYVPASGESQVFLDDIALIRWEGSVANASAGFNLGTPNAWSHLRFTTTNPALASLGVTLTHRAYETP